MADLLEQVIVHSAVQGAEQAFIESRDMTIAFSSYDGHGMFLSMGNIRTTARVGLLFIDFETPHRLRVQGTASANDKDPLLAAYPGADLVVRVAVSRIFVNCSRYVHRYERVKASRYVPRAHCETPFAEWKRIDLVQESLSPRDAGTTAKAGGTITVDEYETKLAAGEA